MMCATSIWRSTNSKVEELLPPLHDLSIAFKIAKKETLKSDPTTETCCPCPQSSVYSLSYPA